MGSKYIKKKKKEAYLSVCSKILIVNNQKMCIPVCFWSIQGKWDKNITKNELMQENYHILWINPRENRGMSYEQNSNTHRYRTIPDT